MSADDVVALVISVLIAAYLVVALLFPREALMTTNDWLLLATIIVALFIADAAARQLHGQGVRRGPPPATASSGRSSDSIYRVCGIDPDREQRWTVYALSLLAFSVVSVLVLFVLQRVQRWLPLNPNDMQSVPPALAFNTAVSFVTNTNWQNYSGESTMSHLTQMAGLAVQNFVSAAVGLAVAIALIRGLIRRRSATIGNFWVDLTRSVVRILLPLSFVAAIVLVSQGVIQNFSGNTDGAHRAGRGSASPRRSGRQSGGDQGARDQRRRPLNANSAHPFESPNGFTHLVPDLPARDPVRARRTRSGSW